MKIHYFDLETSGLSQANDDLWQFAAIIEEDGEIIEEINVKMRPRNIDRVSTHVLNMFNLTKDEMMEFMPRKEAYVKILKFFSRHTDIKTRNDSLVPCGHNIAGFDMYFFKKFFTEEFPNAKIHWQHLLDYHCIDTVIFAQIAALSGKLPASTDSLRLGFLCEQFGIEFDEEEAHDALYDVTKTRELFHKFLSVTTIDDIRP